MLGEYKKTERGFGAIEFSDAYGTDCSVQQSSAIGDYEDSFDNPGTSFLWIGINEPKPVVMKADAEKLGIELTPGPVAGWMPYPIPGEVVIPTRMHLNREQVEGLIEILERWLETGSVEPAD
jgi:hypothetical protein